MDQYVCSFEGCGRKVSVMNLCASHNRQRRAGEDLRPIKAYNGRGKKPECTFPGCVRPQISKELCRGHYTQHYQGKELTPISNPRYKESCSVEGCRRQANYLPDERPMCGAHYDRWKRYGDPLKSTRDLVTPRGLEAIRDAVANRDRSECWLDWETLPCWGDLEGWGGKVAIGYPVLGSTRVMHLSMEADGRPRPPAPANHGLHSCDIKLCWNPDHLRWGTNADNHGDRAGALESRVKHRNLIQWLDANGVEFPDEYR